MKYVMKYLYSHNYSDIIKDMTNIDQEKFSCKYNIKREHVLFFMDDEIDKKIKEKLLKLLIFYNKYL